MNENWKKNIIIFLASQTISLFGSSLVQYAITWHITLETQSGIMMTISIICGFLPTFFLSPFAGVWADRYNRKILIILSDSLIALSTLIMAILFLIGYDAMWLLFVMSAIRAFGSAVQMPAISAVLPQIVPEDKLTKINATNGSIQSLVMLISPMLSGALLSVATIESIFFIDVITAAIAVTILILLLHVPTHEKAMNKQTVSYFEDMYKGYEYIKSHGFIKAYFAFSAVFFLLIAPAAFLTPLQVTRSFSNDVWRLTIAEISFSGGMMIGGIIMATWGGFRNKVHTMTFSNLVFGVATVALGVIPILPGIVERVFSFNLRINILFWVYMFFMLLIGVVVPVFNTPATVLLQEKVEPDFLGRVFGIFAMISSTMMPLGMLVFGPLADFTRIEWLLIGTGLLLLIQSLFMLKSKILIEAGKPVAEAE